MRPRNKYKAILLTISLLLAAIQSFAHPNAKLHVMEMYSVLPFATDVKGNIPKENLKIKLWLQTITSDLIDNYKGEPIEDFDNLNFYDYVKREFGFACKHRLLFHWGYNALPWSDDLERKISKYTWYDNPSEVVRFKDCLVREQQRRNNIANRVTEDTFGLAHYGKEAGWANAILAIVYDVHLLGDYVLTDNHDFDGVTPPSKVCGDIINALRKIDKVGGETIVKKIKKITDQESNEHIIASDVISILQNDLPALILESNENDIKNHLLQLGYLLL